MESKRQLAVLKYLEIYFSGSDFDRLLEQFTPNLKFEGPFVNTSTAEDYISTLQGGSTAPMDYKIIKTYEDHSSVCIIYHMIKGEVEFPVLQVFEFEGNKISKIMTVFDSARVGAGDDRS